MNGQRKPRQPRTIRDPISHAILRATRLTDPEIASIMEPVRACETALRQGVATQMQWEILQTTVMAASSIEKSRIVRGLSEHIASATAAIDTIGQRAQLTGAWKPTALHYQELDAITTIVDLHEFQLNQLSAGELHRIIKQLMDATQSQGGQVVRVSLTDLAADELRSAALRRQPAGARALASWVNCASAWGTKPTCPAAKPVRPLKSRMST